MLLKLPIILSSNSFILTHYSQNYSQYKASYYITNQYCYVKNYNISYLNKKSKRFVVLSISNYERVFSVNYVVVDTSNIVLWVSVCVRNMNVKDFALTAL